MNYQSLGFLGTFHDFTDALLGYVSLRGAPMTTSATVREETLSQLASIST